MIRPKLEPTHRKVNIYIKTVQPVQWLKAFKKAAADEGLGFSDWATYQMYLGLSKEARAKLPKHRGLDKLVKVLDRKRAKLKTDAIVKPTPARHKPISKFVRADITKT